MRTNKYLWNKVVMNIYRQMFKEAEPSADFDELIEIGEAKQDNFFMNYYLHQDRQQEIIDEWCKKYKCSKLEERAINTEVNLGCAPNTVRREDNET